MKIDFNNMTAAALKNFKGGEKELLCKSFNDDVMKIMRNTLHPGASIGVHAHTADCEVYYVISGTGTVIMDDGSRETIEAGNCSYCPKGHGHTFINEGNDDLEFFAVVAKV